MLEGRIREELGDVYGALAVYTVQFADGDVKAGERLSAYGIHPERLLLGLLAVRAHGTGAADDTAILDVLVRNGTQLTVMVLAERVSHPRLSEQSIAIDALARMLEPALRVVPLTRSGQQAARQALVTATNGQVEPVRILAIEALHEIP